MTKMTDIWAPKWPLYDQNDRYFVPLILGHVWPFGFVGDACSRSDRQKLDLDLLHMYKEPLS